MSIQVTNGISPALARMASRVSDRRPLLEAMGKQVVSCATRALRDESLRPAPWPARKSGGDHNLLLKSGALKQSIRITAVTDSTVTVGSDRVYAAIHQFGGKIKPKPGKRALVFQIGGKKILAGQIQIPARPFFPWLTPASPMYLLVAVKVEAIAKAKLAKLLRA